MTHSVCDRVAPYQALGYEEIVPSRFIQERVDLNQWDQLTPFNQEKARGRNYIELVTKKNPDAIDMDAWVRLIDESGQIYSVGLDRSFLYNERNVKIVSPAYNEFVSTEEESTRFLITAQQFERLKKRIEADKKAGQLKDDQPVYTIFSKKNALSYATDLLKEVSIELNNKEVYLVSAARKGCKVFGVNMPDWVEKVINFVLDLFKTLLSPLKSLISKPIIKTLFPPLKLLDLLPTSVNKEDLEIVSLFKTQKCQDEIRELRTSIVTKLKHQDESKQEKICKRLEKIFKIKSALDVSKLTPKELKHFIRRTTESNLRSIQNILNNY
jgi:hypothetical protein